VEASARPSTFGVPAPRRAGCDDVGSRPAGPALHCASSPYKAAEHARSPTYTEDCGAELFIWRATQLVITYAQLFFFGASISTAVIKYIYFKNWVHIETSGVKQTWLTSSLHHRNLNSLDSSPDSDVVCRD
jgi:hypothetical protein